MIKKKVIKDKFIFFSFTFAVKMKGGPKDPQKERLCEPWAEKFFMRDDHVQRHLNGYPFVSIGM